MYVERFALRRGLNAARCAGQGWCGGWLCHARVGFKSPAGGVVGVGVGFGNCKDGCEAGVGAKEFGRPGVTGFGFEDGGEGSSLILNMVEGGA